MKLRINKIFSSGYGTPTLESKSGMNAHENRSIEVAWPEDVNMRRQSKREKTHTAERQSPQTRFP